MPSLFFSYNADVTRIIDRLCDNKDNSTSQIVPNYTNNGEGEINERKALLHYNI